MNKTKQSDYVRQKHEYKISGRDDYFYMYIHVRADTLEPFYVGKGSGSRAWNYAARNKYWKHTAKKHGVLTEIVFDDLTETESLQCEVDSIIEYLYIGYKLCNLNSGGDSPVLSEESRSRMSKARMGRKNSPEAIARTAAAHTGMKRSPETCKRISEALKGKPCNHIVALRRGARKRAGANCFKADKNVYRFIQECGDVFVGCRYQLIEKYPDMHKLLGKLFGKNPRKYSKGWALVHEYESDQDALLKFNKAKVSPTRDFINTDGRTFRGTFAEFCVEFNLSKGNYFKLFNTKPGASNISNGWKLIKETNGID